MFHHALLCGRDIDGSVIIIQRVQNIDENVDFSIKKGIFFVAFEGGLVAFG